MIKVLRLYLLNLKWLNYIAILAHKYKLAELDRVLLNLVIMEISSSVYGSRGILSKEQCRLCSVYVEAPADINL